MAPRTRKRRAQHTPKEDDELTNLISQMEDHMALDRILEARKVVNQIQLLPTQQTARLSPKQQEEINHIVQESNHVQELLHDLQSDNGWTLCKCRKGVTVHYRKKEGDPIHAVKTRTILENCEPSDFIHLCSLFAESDLLPQWFPNNVLDSVEKIVEPSKYRQVLRMTMKFHYMPIADREVICEGIGYHIQEENAFLLLTKSIDTSPYCDIPPIPPRMVRMETKTAFMVKLLPGGRCLEFCQISHDDLKFKYVPAFVTNYVSQGTVPFELIQSMKRVMSNYYGSQWDMRVCERRDFYQEIEERVEQELLLMNAEQENNVNRSGNMTESSRPGLSLEKAVCIMSTLAAFARWSFDRFQFPLWLCGISFLVSLAVLTHSVYIYSHKFTRKQEY